MVGSLFRQQFTILCWKNWVVLSKHSLLNILRCLLLPIGYGAFLAVAQKFLVKPNNYGFGSPISVYNFRDRFDGSLALVWADGTNGAGTPSAEQIMARITGNFTPSQLQAVRQVATPADIPTQCPQNFNMFSQCFAGIAFNSLPMNATDMTSINYTISADGGLAHINVYSHTSDFETRMLPLQWALDQAIIELKSGQGVPTPMEWPYNQETNQQQATNTRLSFIRGIRTLLVIALFTCYIGIAYHPPGAFTSDRANLLTSHMKAMGLLDTARIISWHISISLAYLPARIVVSIVYLRSWSFLRNGPTARTSIRTPMMELNANTSGCIYSCMTSLNPTLGDILCLRFHREVIPLGWVAIVSVMTGPSPT